MHTTTQKLGVGKILERSLFYVPQGYIYLIQNTAKAEILWNMFTI